MNKSFFTKLFIIILIIFVIVLSYFVITLKKDLDSKSMSSNIEDSKGIMETENVYNDTSATDENVADASDKSEDVKEDDVIYVGIFDCLLGSFEQGKWYNAQYDTESNLLLDREFSENEIKNEPEYYLHIPDQEVVSLGTNIIDVTEDYEYLVDENGTIVDSHFRFKINFEELNSIQIVTNKKESIFPIAMGKSTLTPDTLRIVNKAKADLYLDMIDTELVKVVTADIDSDNKTEEFVLIETKHDEDRYAIVDEGACVLAIMIDNNDYKVLYKEVVYKDQIAGVNAEMYLSDLVITDINYNGKPEVCITGGTWDIPMYAIYEYDDTAENFETVLYGEFAW